MPKSILLLHGPNLNLLGTREPEIYGSKTLADVNADCIKLGKSLGVEIICEQENSEGVMIDHIQSAMSNCSAIVINPAGYSHTSVVLRDALVASGLPIYEVHISNIHKRELFRHHSYISGIAEGVICGLGTKGYELAVLAAVEALTTTKK
ncbi:MAG: 3-dehydroquinate dehydratase-2 [Polaribacter sp.]|jgi:3-dehydroquinate dehydratase-2